MGPRSFTGAWEKLRRVVKSIELHRYTGYPRPAFKRICAALCHVHKRKVLLIMLDLGDVAPEIFRTLVRKNVNPSLHGCFASHCATLTREEH